MLPSKNIICVACVASTLLVPFSQAQESGGPDAQPASTTDATAAEARKLKKKQIQAVTNARQIGLAMFDFESEYGSFPNEETAAEVKETSGRTLPVKPKTADDFFYQLFAAGIIDDLRVFSLEAPAGMAPSKANKSPEKPTRCSFSYVSGMNAAGHPGRPLVMTPMVSGKATFDPKPLGGKAFVLFCDNSVRAFPIEADGRVLLAGKDLFDPAQPFWNGKVPPIKWPDSSKNVESD